VCACVYVCVHMFINVCECVCLYTCVSVGGVRERQRDCFCVLVLLCFCFVLVLVGNSFSYALVSVALVTTIQTQIMSYLKLDFLGQLSIQRTAKTEVHCFQCEFFPRTHNVEFSRKDSIQQPFKFVVNSIRNF
jgi:hypothetical protein